MSRTSEFVALRQAQTLLANIGVLPKVVPALDKGLPSLSPALLKLVTEEVSAYLASGNPEVLPDLGRHGAEHVHELRRLLSGGELGDFQFVKAHGERRATQRFPIEAILHAYRCGHKVLAQWMRDAALATPACDTERAVPAIADFAIEYTNTISTVLAAAYVEQARKLAEDEGDRRTELLNILLTGFDESDGRVGRLLKRAGYLEQRLSFCVVLAQSTDPLEMESSDRARRIAEAIGQTTAETATHAAATLGLRNLIGVRGNVVTAVFSATRRQSGWTAPQATLAMHLKSALMLLGPAVMIGISSDQPSTSFIPKALHEATIALDFTSVTERLVLFSELPVRRLLVHRAGGYVQSALPAWISALSAADAKLQGALIETLRAYADADMNILKAARALKLHPNTLYSRMERINALTGLHCQGFHDLTELLLAVECRGESANARPN